jgi:phosphoglycolate phosphatase
MIKTLVFDYDGTIHNSSHVYIQAFREVQTYFVENELLEYRHYLDADIKKWLGVTPVEMWNDFAPHLSYEHKKIGSSMIGEYMKNSIHQSVLYDDSLNVLQVLKDKGYKLIFLSNCKHDYMVSHMNKFNLYDYFEAFYCAEDYDYIPKHVIFNDIKKKFDGEYMIIGDRNKDIEIKNHHSVKTIGCTYGYGKDELDDADILIDSISELLNIL